MSRSPSGARDSSGRPLIELLETPARQAATLEETAHRPWPLPKGSWIQGQTWEHLLFAHWRVDEEALRALVPEGLRLDTFDGSAWLGVTPFRVSGFRLRGTLPLPIVSTFLELNVRTYVSFEDKPGIWFFSLDAESRWIVEAARRTYKLPYHAARMSAIRHGDRVEYASARGGAVFEAGYRPSGRPTPPQPETLEHFLTERYCLYAEDRGQLKRADIHHPPWPLQPAEAQIERNTMPPDGVELPHDGPLLHYAERQDVVIWPLVAAHEAA